MAKGLRGLRHSLSQAEKITPVLVRCFSPVFVLTEAFRSIVAQTEDGSKIED